MFGRNSSRQIWCLAGALFFTFVFSLTFAVPTGVAHAQSTQSNWTGKPICGGEDLQTGKIMPPCGYSKAKFARRATADCPKGSFFDIGTWACYACPTGFNRTANDLNGPAACSKRVRKEMAPAKRHGRYNKCPKNSFFDPRNGGECWQCPPGFGRTAAAVTEWNACGKALAKARSAELVATVCPKGTFADGRNGGECWACPDGFLRSAAAVTGLNACYRDEMLQPAKAVTGGICPKGTFFDPIRNGSCWSCPKDAVRTVFSVTDPKACENPEIRWDSPKRDAKSLFHIPGGEGVTRAVILERTRIEVVSRAMAKEAKADPDEALARHWQLINEAPHESPVLIAAVYGKLTDVIENGARTDAERDLLNYFTRYIQDTRRLAAIQIRDAYKSWEGSNWERKSRAKTKVGRVYSLGVKPPDMNQIVGNVMGVTSTGMLFGGFSLLAVNPSYVSLGKSALLGSLVKSAMPLAVPGAQAKAAGAITSATIAQSTAAVAGPLLILTGAAIVGGLGIDIIIANEQAQAKIEDAIAVAKRKVVPKRLLLSEKGETELLANWMSMTQATQAPAAPLTPPVNTSAQNYQGRSNVTIRDGGSLVTGSDTGAVTIQEQALARVDAIDWATVDGIANDISVAPDGTAWLITQRRASGGFAIVHRDRQRWRQVPGGANLIAASGVAPLAVDSQGKLLYFLNDQWHDMAAPVSVLDVSSNGQVIGIVGGKGVSGGKEIHIFAENKWTKARGGALQIAVGSDSIWIVNNQGKIRKRQIRNSPWTAISGPTASNIAIGGDNVWIIGGGVDTGKVFRRAGNRWDEVDIPAAPKAFALHDDGSVWLVLRDGKIVKASVN